MKRQFLSIILSVTLLASAIAGAISVSIKSAIADEDPNLLYWADFREQMLNLTLNTNYTSEMIAIFNEIESKWNNQSFNVWVMIDPNGNISLLSLLRTNGDGFKGSGWTSPTEYQLTSGTYPSYFKVESYFIYANGSFRFVANSSANISNPSARRSIIDLTTTGNPDILYCTPFEMQAAGWHCYSLRDMSSGNTNGYTMTANITEDHYVPPVVDFTWVKFNIGERWFLTVSDQSYIYGLWNDGEGGYNRIFLRWYADWMEDPSDNVWLFQLMPSNMSSVPTVNAPTSLTNISGDHFYAFDITDLIIEDIQGVTNGRIIHYVEDTQGEIVRATELATHPDLFSLVLTPDQENYSLNDAWNQYNTYVNNYNLTHVVPEQLGEWLFSAEGSKMLPCTIQVPSSVAGSSTSYIDVFSYYTGSMNTSGYNFDIMDVVIIDAGASTGYQLRYWYDDSLTPAYANVDHLVLANIIDSFDIVIISNDDQGWFEEAMAGSLAYTGSSSQGIIHSYTPLIDNSSTAFMLITRRGIQKQQLFNFNDGFTKLYQLEVDYIDSEDKWKDSFLLWSASMFDMLNSLDGRLNTINTNLLSISSLLESIKTAVENIANSDDPDNLSPWYLSLWNWISNFRPSDSDFAATLNQYDNNWDDFPELPAPSTVPLLPGGE